MDPASAGVETRSSARRDVRTDPVVRSLLLALLAVLVLFLGFELMERIWLNEADLEFLQLAHRIRGTAAILVAAGLASWLILRDAPPLLAAGPLPNERSADRHFHAERKQLHHARWFILMRWIAVVAAGVLVLAAVEIAGLLPREAGPRLGAVIAGLALLNLGYTLYLRRGRVGSGFLALQTYADVAVLILLLHFSGGVENPLTPLLLLHVIIAGIVLGRLHSYTVAAVASGLFAVLTWGEWSGVLTHYALGIFPHPHADGRLLDAAQDSLYASSRVGLQTAILLLVAYFTTTLVERIRHDEHQLELAADEALAQAQLLERALDTAGTALCLCDRELQPYWTNQRWAGWVNQAPEICCSVTSPGSAGALTLDDGRVRVREVRVQAESVSELKGASPPSERVLHVTTAPLRDREGHISHVVTLTRDVTAEQEAQARLVRAERLAAVGELAGQVAHEVNNPIAIISAKARLLLRDPHNALPEKVTSELRKITELTDRVARIARGLLSYCRPAPGMREVLDVRVSIRKALAYLEVRALEAGVRISDELPAELPPVCANASELEQVFLNLFLNSLDAMPQGGRLRVGARVERAADEAEPSWVETVVEDTGSGIPAVIRERVFDPFVTSKSDGQGSGLGLSICLGLVRSHGGRIAIESEPDECTRVTVHLPVARPAGRSSATNLPTPSLEITVDV